MHRINTTASNGVSPKRLRNYLKDEHNASFFRLCCMLLAILVVISILKGQNFWTVNNIKSIMLQFPEFG